MVEIFGCNGGGNYICTMSNKSKKETEVQGAEVESFERANLISTVENTYNDSRETKKEQAKSVSYSA